MAYYQSINTKKDDKMKETISDIFTVITMFAVVYLILCL